MAWFKVDDKFHSHRKVKSIPRAHRGAAVGLWLMAGTWVAGEAQDGIVPDYMIREFGASMTDAKRLETAGLWERNADDLGWIFHDWYHYQFSKEQTLVQNAKNATKQKRYRQRKQGDVTGSVTGNADDVTDERYEPPTLPDPSPPYPDQEQHSPTVSAPAPKQSKRTRIPEDFKVTSEMVIWARNQCPNITQPMLDLSTRKFVDHFENATRNATKSNWLQTWRNWVESDYQRTPAPTRTNGHAVPIRSTTDDRVNATLALAQRYAAEDAATRMEIAR